jgi:predicted dehydrogenase
MKLIANRPLRLGMLGMWHTHADGMVRQIAAHPEEFLLVGCYDPEEAVARAQFARWQALAPGARLAASADELLRLPLDAVVVEGRVHQNLQWARLALESGRPVLLEKPAGDNLAEYRQVVALAREKGLYVQMSYLFRSMSAVSEMLSLARSGALGQVYLFRGRLPKDLALYDRYVDELGRYGGGIFFEMAGHLVDMLVAICGAPARVTPFLRHDHSRPPASFVDNGVAIFECAQALGIVEVTALEAVPNARRIEVYGTRGAAIIPHLGSGHLANDAVQPLEVCLPGEDRWQTRMLPARALQIGDLREFAAVLAGLKAPDFPPAHDQAVQEALLRACGMEKC